MMSAATRSIVLFLLSCLLPFTLALNLINYYWLDTVFGVLTLVGIYFAGRSWSGFKSTFGLKKKVLLSCLAIYLTSGVLGYIFYSPLQSEEWREILNLRWIWGFFACYAAGHILSANSKKVKWHFIALVAVLAWILFRHYRITSGEFMTPDARLQGFYSNPNYLALAVVPIWSFLLAYVLYSSKNCLSRTGAVLALALSTIVLIGTYSRTSWIGIVCALLVALFYAKNRKAAVISAFILTLTGLAITFNLFELKDRILYTFDLSGANSQFARLTVWKVAWQIFLDHPLFGVGFENNSRLHPAYYVKIGYPNEYIVLHAHNQFLDVLSGAGIFGFIGYLGTFGSGLVFFHRRFKSLVETHKKQLALGSLLCIVSLFACSFTDAPFRLHEARNYILILLGFSYGYLDAPRENSNDSTIS